MSDSNEKIHMIDQYLVDALDTEKAKEVERLIQEDEGFAELVRERRNLKEGIEHSGRKILKDKIKAIHEKSVASSNVINSKKSSSYRIVYLILGLLIGLALAYFAFNKLGTGGPSIPEKMPEYLYAQYFEPLELSDIKRSNATNQEELQRTLEIEKLYSEKNYAAVIPLLQNKLAASTNKSSSDLIALGISFMETNNDESAIPIFNEVLASKDFNFENDATWYLGLIQLRKGNFDEVKNILQTLADDVNADYHKEALTLLKDLQ